MVMDTLVEKATKELRRHGASAVYLFGSYSSGAPHGDSDIDLAVKGLPPARFFRAMADA